MCDFAETNANCKCRRAVLKTYCELRDHHAQPHTFAFEAACIVYRHHHPEDATDVAQLKVESWINAGHLH